MGYIRIIFLVVLLILPLPGSHGFAADSALKQAGDEYICSWLSLSAYRGRLFELAKSELQARGWDIEPFRDNSGIIDAKFYIARYKDEGTGQVMRIISVTGTESKKDVRADLRWEKVPFGGTTVAEFAALAKEAPDDTRPMVHKGFDEYTRTAFFTTPYEQERTLGEALRDELKANPTERLYLTGHSLGGAAATLLAARLIDMGVAPEQLQVITFGAPAVGNVAFAEAFQDKMHLDRIVITDDPVKGILQTVTSGYKQFGTPQAWKSNANSQQFSHSIVLYADAALRNYYDHLGTGTAPAATPSAPLVYGAPPSIHLDDDLVQDQPYMAKALQGSWQAHVKGYVQAPEGAGTTLTELCQQAREQNCSYVLLSRIEGKRIKSADLDFRMTLHVDVYDKDGHFVTSHEAVTHTAQMTPIEAVLYDQIQARRALENLGIFTASKKAA